MATQIFPVLSPVGGIRYDLPGDLIGDMEATDARNTTVENGETVKRYGYARLGTNLPLSGACIGADYFTLFSGTRKLLVATVDDVYEYNTTTKLYENITTSTELDACDSDWASGLGDTLTHDTSVKMRGTASLKLTLIAERSANNCLAYKAISSADISAHTAIGFWVRSSVDIAAGGLKVVVSESDHATGERTGTYVESDCTALTADTWTFVRTTETLTTLNAVISVSLFAGGTLASNVALSRAPAG